MTLSISDLANAVLFLSVWSCIFAGVPGFFATRAVITGWIYAGGGEGFSSSGEWIRREANPARFWAWVVFYYLFVLLGSAPWILLLVFGLKKH